MGTTNKQVNAYRALLEGLEYVGPKMRAFVEDAKRMAPSGKVAVHCWRGGQRSSSMGWLLDLAGMDVQVLEGGYKAYRNHVLEQFASCRPRLLIVGGPTGSGKTDVIHSLEKLGEQVIDLEGLANHRGSAFGGLGLQPQPGQKQFEALLWQELEGLRDAAYLVTEGESLHIGRLQVPKKFHQAMQVEKSLWLNASLELRTRIILEDYPALDQLREQFERPLLALKERLGKQVVAELLELLQQGQWEQLVRELMVRYYDPLYLHTLPEQRLEIELDPLEQGCLRVAAALDSLTPKAAF